MQAARATTPTALSIAGSDPTGGAGLQADLQVFRAHGVHGAGVVTALTVQDSVRVHRSLPVFPNVVLEQLRVLLRDIAPGAVKIGMLATDDVARNVLLGLDALAATTPIVLDPVLAASDGSALLERRAWGTLVEIARRAALVTPNLAEATALTGIDSSTRTGAEQAARFFVDELGVRAVLVKGGHREGAPDDLLAQRDAGGGVALTWLEGARIEIGGGVHGTGCALSAAIAARIARGETLRAAVDGARDFVARAIARSREVGRGARFLGIE